MTIWDRAAHGWALAGAAAAAAAGAGCMAAGEGELGAILLAGAPLAYFALMRRSIRRLRLSRRPVPAEWRRLLESHVGFYRRLPPERRAAFERDVALFIRENRFSAVAGAQVTDELRVLAAASAVMLLFGRTGRDYPRIQEILFYPGPFDDEYRTKGRGRDTVGMNHAYGAVVLSVPELRRSFASAEDGFHVGLHEFAHALDLSGQEWDGLPLGMDPRLVRPWSELLRAEMERSGRGRGVLREYAGTNEAECFAVAVELFFERPEALRRGNPRLYALLEAYFGERRDS